jgi:hypothetical protein
MRAWIWLGTLFVALGGLAAAPEASAGDCPCECAPSSCAPSSCAPGHSHGSYGRSSTRYVVPRHRHGWARGPAYRRSYDHCRGRSYGTSWSVLRRYLPGAGRDEIRRAYVRSYFLRRFPFALGDDAEAGRIDALLAQADEAGETPVALPPEARLKRGMARFYVADYTGARTDFDAVLAARPDDARARYGRLFCAVCKSEWSTAARDLAALAAAGELKPDDRVAAGDAISQDADTFAGVVEGLRGYAKYRLTDGDAHLLAAWALAVSDREDDARIYARLARRWDAPAATLAVIERNLGLAPAAAPAPVKAPAETPVPAPRPRGEAPGAVIAQAAAAVPAPAPGR